MNTSELLVLRGRPLPLGASFTPTGANFAIHCRHGTSVTLVLLPENGGSQPLAEFPLDPRRNRTGDHWHIRLDHLPNTFCYGWRIDGPTGANHRFDPRKILLDPYATMLSGQDGWATTCEVDPERTSRRGLFHRTGPYDWGDDAPPLTPLEDTIIYELHVRAFTCDPTSGVVNPGTYRGLIEKIPYLQELGITAVELLPIHEFDECDCPFTNPHTGQKLVNFWGYNSIAFTAPKADYAATAAVHGQVDEFREMVRAFHKAGIEVYLDVVFNHTGEGDDRGRTYSFRGIDNELYYLLDEHGRYQNFSGCGNTLNCNHPIVRELIMDSLRYWVGHMHVDGFRFDLASVLGRDRRGEIMMEPPIIEMITEDGVLAHTKLIAEPWDAGGAYQVGRFPYGRRWSEWNGQYRDDLRRFWRGERGLAGTVASRIAGSSDLYQWSGRLPRHSVNFITCHDGFTLHDLVSYNGKHNSANGEQNRDGSNDNYSWNCGTEGPTTDPEIIALRERQARNFMGTLLLSQGVPMILAGDEFLRTQDGNNNAWCQDNALSWIDWRLLKTNAGFYRFTREMIHFRKRHPALRRQNFFQGERMLPEGERAADIRWHGQDPTKADFSAYSQAVAYTVDGRLTDRETDADFYIIMNARPKNAMFRVPPAPSGRAWHRVLDTREPSPADFLPEGTGPIITPGTLYPAMTMTLVVLVA
ncbi:MAG: glycogen debranching protein GlgX [Gemmataceae bacterium]